MYDLPEPKPTAPTTGQADRNTVINQRADQMLAALNTAIEREKQTPTAVRVEDPSIPSFKDGVRIGDAQPVWQDDKRIVPAWAAGIAVASIGVGAGVTGVGCGAWLVLNALASVTLNGVLMVTLPFAGFAMAATAVGGAINKARNVNVTNIRNGPTYEEHHTTNTKSIWSKTINPK